MPEEKKSVLVNIADFGKYGPRYGRPWLAKLKGTLGSAKLTYDFVEGAFVENEFGGTLMGCLSEGDYIAYGQKDFHGNNSVSWYGIYLDGRLQEVSKQEIIRTLSYQRGNK